MILLFLLIVILVCLSAFFSASEMVFSSANRVRLENAAEDKVPGAALALKIVDRFDKTLSSVLVGNNLVNIATSSIGSLIAVTLWGEQWTWLMTLILTITVIIFGETMPKIVAKKNANRLALILCYPIRILTLILTPVTLLVVGLVNLIMLLLPKSKQTRSEEEAEQELQSIIETAEDEKVLDEEQSELLQAAIAFDDTMVCQIMTARVDMEALDLEDDLAELIAAVDASDFSRLPVYEDSIDHIVGVLSQNKLYRHLVTEELTDLRDLLDEPVCLYKTTKLPQAIAALKEARQSLAIVIDEYGGTMGIVTDEDIMEELVGNIWDETDQIEADEIVEYESGIYEFDGDTHIYDFADTLGWNPDELEIESETVGGMTTELHGTFPEKGTVVSFRDVELTVLEVDGFRVNRVRVTRVEQENEEDE